MPPVRLARLLSALVCALPGPAAWADDYEATKLWWMAQARTVEDKNPAVVFQLPLWDRGGKTAGAISLLCPSVSPRGPFLQIPAGLFPGVQKDLGGKEVQIIIAVNRHVLAGYFDRNRVLVYLDAPPAGTFIGLPGTGSLRQALLETKDELRLRLNPKSEAGGVRIRLVRAGEAADRLRASGLKEVGPAEALAACGALRAKAGSGRP